MRAYVSGLVTLVLVLSTQLSAQSPTTSDANPVSQAISSGWNAAKQNISGSARVMPEAKYSFKPVENVRSFGAILAHVAGANYVFCSAAKGENSPQAEDAFENTAKTRADIMKALEDSFTYCEAAYAALNDRTLGEMITAPFGGGQSPRAETLMGNTGHLQEHYGNLVTYLRINGLVPPSSAR